MLVIATTKFTHGARLVIVLIPVLIVAFLAVNRHYQEVAAQLSLERYREEPAFTHTVLLGEVEVRVPLVVLTSPYRSLLPHHLER